MRPGWKVGPDARPKWARMLVSADRDRFVEIDPDKVSRGSFYTTDEAWLNAPVRAFLSDAFLTNTSALGPVCRRWAPA